jgi:spore photoproduct lyase
VSSRAEEAPAEVGGYADKLQGFVGQTLLPRLDAPSQDFIRELALTYRFTFQELRQVAQAARDLEMWAEGPLESLWRQLESSLPGTGRQRKKALLQGLGERLQELSRGPKVYPEAGLSPPRRRPVRLEERHTDKELLGLCPAYSDRTVCCGLYTLDAVRGCPFGCSYCTIQTFYGQSAELESDLSARLNAVELDPDRRYHIGTGQSSDSLVWGNRGGQLDSLLGFAADHPNVLVELKSKSDNVHHLLEAQVPDNVVCSWSLSTETLIRNEEHFTASLERRLAAARSVADSRTRVAFHFHPMIHYHGWRADYSEVARRLVDQFRPSEVAFVSMGSVTLIKPVAQEIRRRGGHTKILQMELVPDVHGKLTYPDSIKLKLFQHLYRELTPWHGEVFFYLCMEPTQIWEQTFGHSYPTNQDFADDFHRALK